MNKNSNYFLGLDIGTGSVGWAITNEKYELLKINRKLSWGSLLFNTANGAQDRRNFRCSRRRIGRIKERIKLLQDLFENEIEKVDKGFYLRLKESRYVYEDKRDDKGKKPELPYSLFVDENYKDDDYHKDYPTIYHLRYSLITENKKFDIRLVYLAIEHIIKHRGHFLSNVDVEDVASNKQFKNLFDEFLKNINERYEDALVEIKNSEYESIKNILTNRDYTKSKKSEEIIKIFNCKNKSIKELVKIMIGMTGNIKIIFNDKEIDDDSKKICFDSVNYEDEEEKFITLLGDDYELIATTKSIYNWSKLSEILVGSKSGYISEAKKNLYEKHKKELKDLKDVVKEYIPNNYKKIFGIQTAKKEKNYSAYIGMVKKNGVKIPIEDGANKEEFYKFLNENVIKKLEEINDERIEYIKEEIEKGTYLLKQRTNDNSVIPYQVHEAELLKILDNASNYYSFLNVNDKDGICIKDKIHSIMTFRIPYYVGPLNPYHNDKKNGHAWIVKKEEGKIYPWNFDNKVDIEASATKFIEKMVNKCSYLKQANVLPKRSLTYEKFMVLNELNNLKIKGEPISVSLKQDIYHNLFEKHNKITIKKLINFLKIEGYYNDINTEDISGIDGEFKNGLVSYLAFKELFTNCKLTEEEKEDIIKDITIFGADENLLKKRLYRKYPGYENSINKLIKKIKSDLWGRLSKEFLQGENLAIEVPGEGKVGTIMYKMWNTNYNLMQLLSKDFPYIDMINKINGVEKIEQIKYDIVENLYVSPAVKRQIWKSVQVIKEIKKIMGKPPKRIFVEMAREKQESKRSITRKDKLMALYNNIKKEQSELFIQLQNTTNNKLRRDKLYLYYTQMGKCAYTGKDIPLDELMKENSAYDIDHIYPQSKTADDSLDNRVLVYKPVNQQKNDVYPLDISIRNKMGAIWKAWMHKGLISKEKFNRLTGTAELTREQLMGFVNRQLVETRQSTKAVTEILRKIMPKETEIVFVKAGNVSRFRNDFGILKVREMNDMHHAKDAYLNIVVGNSYHLYFTKDIRKFFMKNGIYRTYNLVRMFDKKDIIYKDECAWKSGNTGTICVVKNMIKNNRVLITRQVYEQSGQLFNVLPLKKSKGQIPLKSDGRLNDINKYGGYNSATIAYFILIQGRNKKNKEIKYIVPIPLIYKNKYEQDDEWAVNFIKLQLGDKIKFEKVLRKKILIQTLFIYKGFKMRLAGKSSSSLIFHNANQVIFDNKIEKNLKEIFKFQKDLKEKKDATINEKSGLNKKVMEEMYECFIEKLKNTIYKNVYCGAIETIEKGMPIFKNLIIEDQAKALVEIFKLFQCTADLPNFSLIGGKKMGAIRYSMNVTDKEEIAIIDQSVTGLYEKIERINKE